MRRPRSHRRSGCRIANNATGRIIPTSHSLPCQVRVRMVKMDRQLARAIVNKLGSTGTPPEFGIEHFTVGLEPYLKVIEDEYLNGILKYNLSSFKLITGNYGGGKTHFLYTVRDLAFRHNYCVAYVSLN